MTVLQQLLADNVKRFRGQLQLTQADLAQRISSSASYISQIELGNKFPSPNMLEKIASALGVLSTDLFLPTPVEGDYKDLEIALLEHISVAIHEVLYRPRYKDPVLFIRNSDIL